LVDWTFQGKIARGIAPKLMESFGWSMTKGARRRKKSERLAAPRLSLTDVTIRNLELGHFGGRLFSWPQGLEFVLAKNFCPSSKP
jgi:hypothetical protein